MVMECIEGNTLFKAYEDFKDDSARSKRIGEQIAGIATEMQNKSFSSPGPFGGGPCRGYWCTEYEAGPFNNKDKFNHYFNHKLAVSQRFNWANSTTPLFRFQAFCLVHIDFTPWELSAR
jgi:hypothetical protein